MLAITTERERLEREVVSILEAKETKGEEIARLEEEITAGDDRVVLLREAIIALQNVEAKLAAVGPPLLVLTDQTSETQEKRKRQPIKQIVIDVLTEADGGLKISEIMQRLGSGVNEGSVRSFLGKGKVDGAFVVDAQKRWSIGASADAGAPADSPQC